MGSSHYRIKGIDLAARCCHGVFYAVGFLTTALVLMVMLWIVWCYFGLALVHVSDGQRRGVVHYSQTSSKPQVSLTSVQGDDALKSIPKSATTSSSFLRGSSRDSSIPSTQVPARNLESGDARAEGAIPSDVDDGIQLRRVASSNDNRDDYGESPKDKSSRRTGNVENVNVHHPADLTSDAKSVGVSTATKNITSERRDEIQSSRSAGVDTSHHDSASKIDSSQSPNRTMIAEDEDRGSRSRYDARQRGSEKREETDDSYSKGDTRYYDQDKTADDSRHGDEKLHSHGEGSRAHHPDEPHRRRGDDDRYADYDDTYKSHGDRPYYRDDRYKTYEGRHRMRSDERYAPRDDDRYRSQDEERYRTDRLKDHGRDTSRVDDRYRTRDMDRSRVDDRYITRDDDEGRVSPEDRYRDDDRDRYRDEGRYRTRYREGDRSSYGDNYRSRVSYRDRDGYHTRGEEDRYRDDTRTKERDYRYPEMSSRDDPEDYPVRGSSAGKSNLEIPSRTILSDSRYKDTDRDEGYKRPSRYDDRDRISPTRVRDDTYSSRPTLMDSRSSSEPVLTESRLKDDDRFPQGSKRYQDDSRKEYRTRMPDESTRYAPRYKDDPAVERRSYGSEEDDEYTSRTRYYDDRSDTRRYFRNRDDQYPRRSRPDDDEEYTHRRTDDDEEYPRRRASADEEYPRRRGNDDEEYSRRRTDEEDFRRSRPSEYYDNPRTRYQDRYEGHSRDDDRYDDDKNIRRYDDRPRRRDDDDPRKEVVSYSSTGERPIRGSSKIDGRDTSHMTAADSSRQSDAEGSMTVERPLSAKDVIEAALRQSDLNDKNPVRKVSYPVFDPRLSNLTSSDIIRPSERRGITIHSRKKRWV